MAAEASGACDIEAVESKSVMVAGPRGVLAAKVEESGRHGRVSWSAEGPLKSGGRIFLSSCGKLQSLTATGWPQNLTAAAGRRVDSNRVVAELMAMSVGLA